jgi:hydroxymethylpyrimidine pyrophosphatase-like HAD family hydrolase
MTYHPRCVIFDIDGTIANIEHRRHWVAHKPKNWAAFNRGMANDTVHEDIVWMLKTLHSAGCIILIASGRGEEQREITENWLNTVAGIEGLYSHLYMRKAKDYRADNIVKSEILDQMHVDGYKPYMWFDDRNQVVNEIRGRGIRCLQVAPGDF